MAPTSAGGTSDGIPISTDFQLDLQLAGTPGQDRESKNAGGFGKYHWRGIDQESEAELDPN